MKAKKYSPTIGLEIHVELATKSKMFCGCPAYHFGKPPNTQTCPVCLGLPGALPVPNRRAIEWTIMIGLALNCKVNKTSKFDRKHYFYPDLPKGYQISQYEEPICFNGQLIVSGKKIRIKRVHIEEDTGKLLHKVVDGEKVTLVDFNRSGVCLVEIVTEPDISSGKEAKEFAQKLQKILRYLKVSDCDMEKGSMRLEANISWGQDLGYKVEVKNLNSFRFVEKAIDYELKRQMKILEKGELPGQETRGWSEAKSITSPQRFKETEADYRYFPEPDIPQMEFSDKLIDSIKNLIPELPIEKAERFIKAYKIKEEYAVILTSKEEVSRFAEKSFKLAKKENISEMDIAGYIVNQKPDPVKISPKTLIEALKGKRAKKVSDLDAINAWVDEAIRKMPEAVSDYKKGKTAAISVLIGYIMKVSGGAADALLAKKTLEEKIK